MTNLTTLVGGRIIHTRNSSYLLVESAIEELNCGETREYVQNNYQKLTHYTLKEHLPSLGHMLKKNMLFCDIESAGPFASDPIISIALAHLGKSIRVSCAFARDPSENLGVLEYFKDQLESGTSLFTYNGNSYDLPRINNQFRAKGIINGLPSRVEEIIQGNHYDLYPLISSMMKLNQKKSKLETPIKLREIKRLQTITKRLFNEYREGDISGRKIPMIYQSYLDGEPLEEDLARIINHNMIDVVDLVALLTYYCVEPKNMQK